MKKAILSLVSLFAFTMSHAQNEAPTAVVKVENDYKPEIVQVSKRGFTPTIENGTEITPLELKFSKGSTPFDSFTSERNIKELLPKQESPTPGYARLGYGTDNGVDAKLAYRLNTGNNGTMRMLAALDGFNTNVEGQYHEWKSRMYRTLLDADYTHEFEYLTLNVVGNFIGKVFNYQKTGDAYFHTDKQDCKNYTLSTTGIGKLTGPFSYSFNAGYTQNRRGYSDNQERYIAQHRVNFGGNIAYEIYDMELRKIGAEVNFDTYMYNSRLRNADYGYSNFLSADINPFLDFNFGEWKLRLGTKINLRTNGGAAFAIAPNIKVDGAFAKNVSLYASITGGRVNNGFEQMDAVSPYWNFISKYSHQLKPTYKVADFTAGSRVSVGNLSMDFHAGYAYTKDDVLQAPFYSTILNQQALLYVDLIQQNTHNIYVGTRAGYDILGWIRVAATARYDFWNCDNKNLLVMKPQLYAGIEAEAEPMKNMTVKANYSITRYTAGNKDTRIGNRYDLNARVNYRINDMFSVYAQGENLLDCNNYEYTAYITRGIRGMLGATVNF